MQFTIRSMIALTAVIAFYCGLVFAAPVAVSIIGLTLLTTLLPPLIVGGIIYARGTARAFWIGCAASGFIPFVVAAYFGMTIPFVLMSGIDSLDDEAWIYSVVIASCHAMVFANGLVVVLSKWLHTRGMPKATQPSEPYSVIQGRVSVVDKRGAVPETVGNTQ